MAKKDKAFWEKLAQDAGLDDAARTALLTTVENKKFEDGLYGALVPREESDRFLSDAKKAQADAEAVKAEAVANYQKNLQWYQQNSQRLTQADESARRVQAYEALYGQLDGGQPSPAPVNGNPQQPQQQYLTREELMTAQRDYWGLQRQLRKIEHQYQKTFSEPLPDEMLDQLEQMAVKPENRSRTAIDMFKELVEPKLEAHRTADIEARVKQAREEAYNEGLAKGRMNEPTATIPDEVSPLYQARPKKEDIPDERTVMSNFIQGLETPAGAAR